MREKLKYTNSFRLKERFYNFYELKKRKKKLIRKNSFENCYVVVNLLRERRLRAFLKTSGKEWKRTYKRSMYTQRCEYITIAVMMAKRFHLFPFRTQKLSSFTPKVLVGYYREDR